MITNCYPIVFKCNNYEDDFLLKPFPCLLQQCQPPAPSLSVNLSNLSKYQHPWGLWIWKQFWLIKNKEVPIISQLSFRRAWNSALHMFYLRSGPHFLNLHALVFIKLHSSVFICIYLNWYAFFIHIYLIVFACIPLHLSAFICISFP